MKPEDLLHLQALLAILRDNGVYSFKQGDLELHFRYDSPKLESKSVKLEDEPALEDWVDLSPAKPKTKDEELDDILFFHEKMGDEV